MDYSFNRDKEGIIFAMLNGVNASNKDLGAVCDAIRYKSVESAWALLDLVKAGKMPVEFRRHGSGIGARHELGGKRGRYPKKCAGFVQKALRNAMANASNKGYLPELMYIVHASANRTDRLGRFPSKGAPYVSGSHTIGGIAHRRSDIELAKIEIGISNGSEKGLSEHMKSAVAASSKRESRDAKKKQLLAESKIIAQKKAQQTQVVKPTAKPAAVAKTKEEKKVPAIKPVEKKTETSPVVKKDDAHKAKDNKAAKVPADVAEQEKQ